MSNPVTYEDILAANRGTTLEVDKYPPGTPFAVVNILEYFRMTDSEGPYALETKLHIDYWSCCFDTAVRTVIGRIGSTCYVGSGSIIIATVDGLEGVRPDRIQTIWFNRVDTRGAARYHKPLFHRPNPLAGLRGEITDAYLRASYLPRLSLLRNQRSRKLAKRRAARRKRSQETTEHVAAIETHGRQLRKVKLKTHGKTEA